MSVNAYLTLFASDSEGVFKRYSFGTMFEVDLQKIAELDLYPLPEMGLLCQVAVHIKRLDLKDYYIVRCQMKPSWSQTEYFQELLAASEEDKPAVWYAEPYLEAGWPYRWGKLIENAFWMNDDGSIPERLRENIEKLKAQS